MRTIVVVMPPPLLDQHPGLVARAEPFDREALVAELAVEALARTVLPLSITHISGPDFDADLDVGQA